MFWGRSKTMATLLDISILENFSIIFTFLLVFVILYAMLEYFQWFGKDKRGLHSLISLAIAFMVIVSDSVRIVVESITPWFLVMILFIFFIVFVVRMFGVGDEQVSKALGSIYIWIIVFAVLILFVGLSNAFGQILLEKRTGEQNETVQPPIEQPPVVEGGVGSPSFGQNVLLTFTNPKVLGMLLILFISMFAIMFLSRS
jgi:magnesium-transporting ATPase (P-type)